MNKLETLRKESPSKEILKWLLSDEIFSSVQIAAFASTKWSPNDYEFIGLKKLMKSDRFKTKFDKQWAYETDSHWEGRTVQKAIVETILHTTSRIAEEAQLELMGKRKGQFPGLTTAQIDIIDKQSQFLNGYFHSVLKLKGAV